MGRVVGGIVAGILVFVALLAALEYLAHQISPAEGSLTMLAIVAGAYFVSALAGGVVAGRISRRAWAPWAIALLVLAGAVWTLFRMPQPVWMQIASVVAPLLAGFIASRVVARQPAGPVDAAI
jgi:MFS family permease